MKKAYLRRAIRGQQNSGVDALASSVTQYGVTYNFASPSAVGQYANGDWWVVSPVTITSITPVSQTVASGSYAGGQAWTNRTINGVMVNPGNRSFTSGSTALNDMGSSQGFDSLGTPPDPGNSGPNAYNGAYNVDPGHTGSSLVFTGGQEGSVVKSVYNPTPATTARAALKDMVVLTVVATAPAIGAIRPPVASSSKTSLGNVSSLNYGVLPRKALVTGAPSLATTAANTQRMVQVGYTNNLASRNLSPVNNQPEYGRDWAHKMVEAALALCLDYDDVFKRDTLVNVVTTGCDVYGRLLEGGKFYDLGGGNSGKKIPLLIAAITLNHAGMLAYCDNALHAVLCEDRQVFTVSQTDVDLTRYTADGRPRDPYTTPMIGTPEWGEQHIRQPNRDGSNWDAFYRQIVGPCTIGGVLAARLITGAMAAWNNQAVFDYYDRYWNHEKASPVGGTNDIQTFVWNMWNAYRGGTEAVVPVVASLTATDNSLWLTYPELLDETSVPPASAFTLTQSGAAVSIASVQVVGYSVILTPQAVITGGSTLLLTYAQPATGKIRDLYSNNAAALSARAVTNTSTVGSTAPVAGDPISLTVLGPTSPSGTNIVPNGWAVEVKFKGMAPGQAVDLTKFSFVAQRRGYDDVAAAARPTQLISTVARLRMPVPTTWAGGQTVTLGTRRTYRSSNTSRVYIVTSAGGVTSNAPTHSNLGSVTGVDDHITWLHLGGADTTSPNFAPLIQYIERVEGSDVVITLVLDDFVFNTDDIIRPIIGAGAYGSSNAANTANLSITNSSTLVAPKPIANMLTPSWQKYTTNTITPEIFVTHPYGRQSRPAAMVRVRVITSAGVDTGVSGTAAAVSASALLTGGPYTVDVFKPVIDWTSLADGVYFLEHEVYPFVGPAYISKDDGFGSLTPTSVAPTANEHKRTTVRKDVAGTYGKLITVVDPNTGNDATGVASPVQATADAAPFLTVQGAAARIQTQSNTTYARNNTSGHEIQLKAGTYTGFAPSTTSMNALNIGDLWLTVKRHSTASSRSQVVINAHPTNAAGRQAGKRTKFEGITLAATSTLSVIDNASSQTISDFAFELWFDDCDTSGGNSGNTKTLSRSGLSYFTRSTMNNSGSTGNENNVSAMKLCAGNTITGVSLIPSLVVVGNQFQDTSRLAVINSTRWNENSQQPHDFQLAFNGWPRCGFNQAGLTRTFTGQFGIVNNFIESWGDPVINAAIKGGQWTADAVTLSIGAGWFMFNTAAGDGHNLAYNENGLSQWLKGPIWQKFNATMDRNSKGDWYDAIQVSEFRTGNWAHRYCVGFVGNAVFAATDSTPSPKNLSGEIRELRSIWVGDPGWVDDRSKTSALPVASRTGNGDYHPTDASAAVNLVGLTSANEQMYVHALDGQQRLTTGEGASGAFERVP